MGLERRSLALKVQELVGRPEQSEQGLDMVAAEQEVAVVVEEDIHDA